MNLITHHMNETNGARAHAIDSLGSKRSNVNLEWVVAGLAEAGSWDGIVRPGSATPATLATAATARARVSTGSKAELNVVLLVNLVVKL